MGSKKRTEREREKSVRVRKSDIGIERKRENELEREREANLMRAVMKTRHSKLWSSCQADQIIRH